MSSATVLDSIIEGVRADVAAREAIVRLAHPRWGEVAMQNVFPKLSRTPGAVRSIAPQSVGEHTTSAVVQSIFVVILLDALAALFYMEMGW